MPARLIPEETGLVIVNINKYININYDDYQEVLIRNLEKRAQVVELHAQPEVIVQGISRLH